MTIVDLARVDAGMIESVGGKAAGLGEMIRAGERVPAGFCLTVESYTSRQVPENALIDAYERLGGGRVAVRSSATAEDLPDASFAGQQDTYLNVEGAGPLVDAVRRCWDSLHTERAVAYRATVGIADAAMAVVVQRMVDPVVAGVLFTANPITGCRTEMIVDAAPGLGTAVVEGTVVPDHYVLDHHAPVRNGDGGALRLAAGHRVGDRRGRDAVAAAVPAGHDPVPGPAEHRRHPPLPGVRSHPGDASADYADGGVVAQGGGGDVVRGHGREGRSARSVAPAGSHRRAALLRSDRFHA
jgi:hypothetical protein